MTYNDIPKLTQDGNYRINVGWDYLEEWIEKQKEIKLDLDPDFQRGHVWSKDKQVKYVEFCLRGGKHSNILRFNCTGWMKDFRGPFVLVDGKQRLEAVRRFLRNDLRIFKSLDSKGKGFFFKDFTDHIHWRTDFIIVINDLKTRKDVLQWYLDINTGGVVHTKEEIEKVQKLLEKEC